MLHLERRVLEISFLFSGIYATELLQCDTYIHLHIMVFIYTVLRNVKNSKHGISVECPKILNNQFQTVMNGAYDVSKSFIFYSILRKINENF